MKAKRLLSALLAILMLAGVCMTAVTVSAEEELPFTDVKKNWSYKSIKYVYENGFMNGTEDGTKFSPSMNLTRAMVITVLYRLEGSPRTKFIELFLDVKDRLYYSEAVTWAKTNNIITATKVNEWGEEYFSPNRDITRQELATMFVRYANYKNIITESDASLDKFIDGSSVAKWAKNAMIWATDAKLINGTGNGNTLSPTEKATREQFAAIIHRFDTATFDYKLAYAEPKASSVCNQPYPLVEDADIYVAVDGNDNNPGTLEKPLATFDAARLKVRELKKTAKDEIVVAFKAGNYGALDNITFTAEDAGSESVPITYCKYGDGDVIFRNGVRIDKNDFKPLDESDKDLFTDDAQPYIYKANLKGKYNTFTYKTRLFSENGQPIEAREPNGTYYTNVTTTVDDHASIMLQHFLPGIVEKFKTIEGLKMNGYLRAGYVYDVFPVLSYDKDTKILTFDFNTWVQDAESGFGLDEYPLMYEGRTDDLTFFSNLSEFLDMNGEYWFDNKTSTLYVYMAKGNYFISNGGTYITVEEPAEYLTFAGFEFDGTDSDAIVVYADHFTLDMCKIGNVGGLAAVNFPDHVRYLTVKNSEFYNCVDHCIYLNSNMVRDDYTLTENKRYLIEGHNVITNNYFHDFTLPDYFSSAISITDDVGTEISHNYFYEGAHGAIRYNMCIDMKIEYNVFDRLMTKTQDYGAVYTWNAVTYIDNHIRYNIFKNIPVYAIYLDNNTAGQLVYGNIFYNNGHSIVQNGGRANYIYDNVFIATDGSGAGIGYSTGYMGYAEEGADPNEIFTHAMYKRYANAKPQPGEDGYTEWSTRWPKLYNTSFDVADYGKLDCVFTPVTYTHDNVGFNVNIVGKGEAYLNGAGEGNKDYTLNDNPLFVNPAIGDYSIREDADYFKIPFDKIGRY